MSNLFAFCHSESIWHLSLITKFFQIAVGSCTKKKKKKKKKNMFSGSFFIVNYEYFFNSWCCILDSFILNCKLWDKFFNLMIILILILPFYRNFEWIFEFMALKRAPICGRNVCLAFCLSIFLFNSENFNRRK